MSGGLKAGIRQRKREANGSRCKVLTNAQRGGNLPVVCSSAEERQIILPLWG